MPGKSKFQIERVTRGAKKKSLWFNSGVAQALVVINGVILTVTAFSIFSYYTNAMSVDEHKKTSETSGRKIVESISTLENAMRLVSSIILLSSDTDKDKLAENIRRNIPHLRNFDQLIWLFEESPGNWQYKTISDTVGTNRKTQDRYRLVPDTAFITRLLSEKIFQQRNMRIIADFNGMDYFEEQKEPYTMARSFAFLKTVKLDDSNLGIVIGVSRAGVLFDKSFISGEKSVSRLTIRDSNSGQRLFHMDRNHDHEDREQSLVEHYSFYVADTQWQVLLEFSEKQGATLLARMPYVTLLFGFVLTFVGTLFIRNNSAQARKLSDINNELEQKNNELHLEIGERERLNQALATSEKDNRAIIDAVSDVIFEVDVEGNVLFLSRSWQTITGFNIDRSLDNNLFTMLYPQDQEKQKHDFNLLVKGQKSAYRTFTRLRISDGTFRAIELAFSMIRQDENKELRIVGTLTDVEERRRAERALAEAEKKYRTIVENAAGGLYQLTPEGLYLSANPAMARILGYYSPEEMLRMIKNANGTVYCNQDEHRLFIETLIKQEHINGYETEVKMKDGSKIWVRENVRVVKDDQNHILYFEGSMEDITQRKEADIALMEAKTESDMASRAKSEFIANMSHELRTPLNAIIGFSDIMKKEVMGPLGQDVYKDYVMDIHQSGEGLLKIINEILDISKMESGNRDLNESEFDLRDTLASCIELHSARAREKEIVIINDATDLPVVKCEQLSIKQVIGNIYSNAIKYTPNHGRITLFTNYDSDGTFRLSITDTGVGMTDHEVKKALSPFGQIDNALDRAGAGAGLGLPLAQSIMKTHDGRLEILSEKSIGTTVTIIFPPERVISKEKVEQGAKQV